MKTKRILIFAMLLIAVTMFASLGEFVFATETMVENEPEIIVEVLVNNNGEEFIENIEFDDGTVVGDYDYEIRYVTKLTRDPIYITYFFDSVAWVTRENGITLSLDPTEEVRTDSDMRTSAWNVLKDPVYGFGKERYWPTDSNKLETFKWQYDCHFNFAKTKATWNIEPWRTASNYLVVVANGCNP